MSDIDILVDIPDDDLSKLLEMYEPHKDSIPHVYSTILTGIMWRKKKKERYMRFMSPNNCWKEDGTFFVLLTYYSFDLFFFSLDDSGKNIYEAIVKTKILDDDYFKDRQLLFFAIHYKFYPTVQKAIRDRKFNVMLEIPNHMFNIPKEEALKFATECPSDVYIKELDQSHVALINSLWPHRYQNSDKFISLLIEMNESYGIFLKSTNELVSWMLLSMMGQLSMLQTVDEHKKKGYASLITKYMSKQLAKKGYNAFGTILVENYPSVGMFKKLGFNSLGIATYILFQKNSDEK